MKKNNIIHNSWAFVLLILFVWMPTKGMAQVRQFELVVEKTDGSEQTFKITDKHPFVFYDNLEGVNTLVIVAATETGYFPCSEVKRLFTRIGREVYITDVINAMIGNPLDESMMKDADINNDGIVNIIDIIMIVNIILSN